MTQKRLLALGVLLIAVLGAGFAVVHARHQRAASSSNDGPANTPIVRVDASPRTQALDAHETSAPTRTAVAADPERSARAWMERSSKVVIAKNAQLLSSTAAHALALPPSEAWSALTARARVGDEAAAAAAMLLANECNGLSVQVASNVAQDTRAVEHLTASLPPGWNRFVRAIDAQSRQRLHARIASCADVGGVWDFALMALDRFMRSDDPDTQLAAAEDIGDDTTAIADLRELAASQADSETSRRALGERLMQSGNPVDQSEGRAMLERLAEDDADVVSFLAACFSKGCGHFRGDPAVADVWVEHAAGLGDLWAFDTRIAKLQAAGQTTDAWAWALYRLDLALAGCFEFGQPQPVWIAQAAQAALRLEGSLDSAQRAAAHAAAQAISIRWEAQAAARLGCAE